MPDFILMSISAFNEFTKHQGKRKHEKLVKKIFKLKNNLGNSRQGNKKWMTTLSHKNATFFIYMIKNKCRKRHTLKTEQSLTDYKFFLIFYYAQK